MEKWNPLVTSKTVENKRLKVHSALGEGADSLEKQSLKITSEMFDVFHYAQIQ